MLRRIRRTVLLTVCVFTLGIGSVALAQSPQYRQNPLFDDLVAQGVLPEVAERLPSTPMVVEPFDEIGQYGGELRGVFVGAADRHGFNLWSWQGAYAAYDPETLLMGEGVITGWEYSDEGRTLSLHLREGLRWSDGTPHTAEDLRFQLEDLVMEDRAEVFELPSLQIGSVRPQFEVVDDFTLRMTWPEANYLAHRTFATGAAIQRLFYARHHYEPYHPKYNPEATWEGLNEQLAYSTFSEAWVGRPGLGPWVVTEYIPGERLIAEANPFFWAVDTAGNQLPYVDRLVWRHVGEAAVVPLEVAAGNIDVQARHIALEDYPFYADRSRAGGFRVVEATPDALAINFSLQHDINGDPVLQDLIANTDFREAVFLGFDWQEINEVLFFGIGEPWGHSVGRESPYYPGDEIAQMWSQRDVGRANALLDEMGLVRGTDGIRVRSDGRPLEIVVGVATGLGEFVDAGTMLQEQLAEIGVRLILDIQDRARMMSLLGSQDLVAHIWPTEALLYPIENGDASPRISDRAPFKEYSRWYNSGGELGREAPAWLNRAWELNDEFVSTDDETRQRELGIEIMTILQENAHRAGGIVAPSLVIVNDRVGNVPESFVEGWHFGNEALIRPYQFYIKAQ